ncbi:trichohyalin-like isoform X7 [Dicentrarchus labrax]|uniref:trichohyalin-like isoform X7 n=1 Tax=Dicentrarchus labrax TaxID=13489 RepID=UPI0021F68F72|nr:trichohyalin-like isoform X7 [Dicentrarchus labrax]
MVKKDKGQRKRSTMRVEQDKRQRKRFWKRPWRRWRVRVKRERREKQRFKKKTLENMEGKSKRGKKRQTKIQEKTLENMEGKSKKGKKRETKIQEKTLENMEGKSEKGKKRETKIQDKSLEKMEGKSEKGKKRETKIQEKALENMEGKSKRGKKRETKIQEKTLENMEDKSEKGKKRETKIQDPVVMTRSKVKEVQKRKLKEEHLEKSERESEEGSSGAAEKTVPDPEEDEEHVPKRTYQLCEKSASVPLNQQMKMTSFKQDGTDKREVECPFQKIESFSSSEGDGSADEWKPTQQESENDSEEEEEQVLERVHKEESEGDFEEEDEQIIGRVHKVAKRKRSESSVLQRELRSSSEVERVGSRIRALRVTEKESEEECTRGESPSLPEKEEEALSKESGEEDVLQNEDTRALMSQSPDLKLNTALVSLSPVTLKTPVNDKVAVKVRPGMQQAFVSPGTATILTTHSTKTVCDRVNMVNKMIFHQSSLFEVIVPISGDNIEHQAGSTVGQMIPSGSMGETVSKEWLLENEVSVGDTTLHKSLPEQRGGEYEGQEKEGEVDEGYLEMSKIEGDRNKLKEGQKTEKETQEETLEKMDSDGEEGQRAEEKIHNEGRAGQKTKKTILEETLEKMESKSEKGKKRETTIQKKTLENMEGKSKRGKKRQTKIQEKALENMEGKSKKGKKRETKIQEKTLENMEGKSEKGKKRETKIQDKSLEKMEGKSEKGKKRETKIQDKSLEKMEGKSEKGKKRETKIQEKALENMEGKSKRGKKRETKIQEKTLENMEDKSEKGKKRQTKIQEKTLENMEGKSEKGKKRETKFQEKTLEKMKSKSEKGKKRETKIQDPVVMTRSKVKEVQKRKLKEEHLEKSERESEEGSSGAAEKTVPDPEEDEEHVPKRTYQLCEKSASVPLNQQMKMTSFKQDGTDKREVECPFQKIESFSSSEGDGSADEWKPTQQESENDSEEEEEQVLERVHKVTKRKRSESLVLQREEESEGDFEEEDEQIIGRVHKVAKRKRSESSVLQRELRSSSEVERVGSRVRALRVTEKESEEECTRGESLCLPEKEEEALSKGNMGESGEEDVLQNEDTRALMSQSPDLKLNTALVSLSPVTLKTPVNDKVAVKVRPGMQQAFVSPGTATILTTHSTKTVCDRVNMVNKMIFHQSSLFEVIMPISGDNIEHQAGSTVGQMIPSGSMGETVSKEWNMEGKSEKGKKRETKIQDKTLENMEGKSEKGKKRETKIQEKTLEKMKSKSEKGMKRETKIKDEPVVMPRSKAKEVQKRKLKEEHLEKSERESEEGSSGAAEKTWKIPLKRRKFQE